MRNTTSFIGGIVFGYSFIIMNVAGVLIGALMIAFASFGDFGDDEE